LNSEKIWKLWKKSKLNSEMIWKLWRKYVEKLKDMEIMEERQFK
jgi:hypothetical protein